MGENDKSKNEQPQPSDEEQAETPPAAAPEDDDSAVGAPQQGQISNI